MNKKKTTILLIGTFIAGSILSPIAVNAAQKVFDDSMRISKKNPGYETVYRYDDPDFKVKCWIRDGYREPSISCLPWKDVESR